MHLVLHPRACPHESRTPSDTPPQRARCLVRHPHRFEHPRRQQLGEHRRIEPIGLHAGMRDSSRLRRVAHDDLPDIALFEELGDHHRATAGLQHHLVTSIQAGRELPDRLRGARDPTDARDAAALGDRDLAEIEMNIQTKELHEKTILSSRNRSMRWKAPRAATTTDSGSQPNRVSRRGGHLVIDGLAAQMHGGLPTSVLPQGPCPGQTTLRSPPDSRTGPYFIPVVCPFLPTSLLAAEGTGSQTMWSESESAR